MQWNILKNNWMIGVASLIAVLLFLTARFGLVDTMRLMALPDGSNEMKAVTSSYVPVVIDVVPYAGWRVGLTSAKENPFLMPYIAGHEIQPDILDAVDRAENIKPITVTAISTSSALNIAVINGIVLHEGDFVDGLLIARIERNAIIVKDSKENKRSLLIGENNR